MSYPVPVHDEIDFIRDVEQNLRQPTLIFDGQRTVAEFFPDLTAPEQAVYARLFRLYRSRLGLTPAEFTAAQPDIDVLRQFVNAASPTAAQTVTAVKSLIRVLRAVLD